LAKVKRDGTETAFSRGDVRIHGGIPSVFGGKGDVKYTDNTREYDPEGVIKSMKKGRVFEEIPEKAPGLR
jgi:hypothetical protein